MLCGLLFVDGVLDSQLYIDAMWRWVFRNQLSSDKDTIGKNTDQIHFVIEGYKKGVRDLNWPCTFLDVCDFSGV